MSSKISDFSSFINQLLSDPGFQRTLRGDVLGPLESEDQKRAVIKAALRCIFGAPQGVRQMPETKNLSHIKNQRNWKPFCKELLDYVSRNFAALVEDMKAISSMYISYKNFWPDNEESLARDVERARRAADQQR